MKEYRVCETCEHPNDVSFLECESCGADLSFVSPTVLEEKNTEAAESAPSKEQTNQQTLYLKPIKLINLTDRHTIDIPPIGGLLGREGTLATDYLAKFGYISNRHVRIEWKGSSCVVTDVGSRNGTWLNGVRLEQDREYPIGNGDRLLLANVEFCVQE